MDLVRSFAVLLLLIAPLSNWYHPQVSLKKSTQFTAKSF